MATVEKIEKYAKKRAKEIKELLLSKLTLDRAEANIAGQKLVFQANVERDAAWKLYVEINTRIAIQPLKAGHGLLREALSSLYNIFGITREILKDAGPEVACGRESLGFYAMEILNKELRPLLAKWHPLLLDWENQQDQSTSSFKHEKNWEHAKTLRAELEILSVKLLKYSNALKVLSMSDI